MPLQNRGGRNDDFTLNIDLAPTLLSAAKIPVPSVMQGRDMSQLYRSSSARIDDWRNEFYYEWFTGDKKDIPASLALVKKDSKYIFWPEYDYEQLFRLGTCQNNTEFLSAKASALIPTAAFSAWQQTMTLLKKRTYTLPIYKLIRLCWKQ